jgi:glycosyltransferase involved in cell wall biosynthesis
VDRSKVVAKSQRPPMNQVIPTLLFDDEIFTLERYGGVSRYFTELIHQIDSMESRIVLLDSNPLTSNEHLLALGRGRRIPHLPRRVRSLVGAVNRRKESHLRPDVLHHTYYLPQYLRQPFGRLRVVTVHDMIPEKFPRYFPRGNPHQAKREFITQADLVFSISETTKADVEEIYGRLECPIVVVPLGVSDRFKPGAAEINGWNSPYLLHVGRRGLYKDFEVLLRAFAKISATEMYLVAVGGGRLENDELGLINELGLQERVTHVDLSEDLLVRAYANAAALVVPSRYEGFGLPVLEAMATGCPVVLSNTPALVEVASAAASYFRVGDETDLANSLESVITDRGLRSQLSLAGLERATCFSWGRSASATVDAYLQHL